MTRMRVKKLFIGFVNAFSFNIDIVAKIYQNSRKNCENSINFSIFIYKKFKSTL